MHHAKRPVRDVNQTDFAWRQELRIRWDDSPYGFDAIPLERPLHPGGVTIDERSIRSQTPSQRRCRHHRADTRRVSCRNRERGKHQGSFIL
jgi:hypothetical protein